MKRVLLMASLLIFPRLLIAQEIDVDGLLGEDWYGLYFNGKKAGYAATALEKDSQGNVISREDCTFRINMVGVPQEMRLFVQRAYGPDGALAALVYDVSDTHIEGRVEGDELVLVSTVAGQTSEERVPKPGESLRDAVEHAQWVRGKPAIGDTMTFTEYDPLNRKEITGRSEIVGTEERVFDGVLTQVYRVKTDYDLMGISKETYVAGDGTTLEDVVSGVLTMRLEPAEVARDVNYSNDTIVSNAAKLDAPIENPRNRETLRLDLHGPLTAEHIFVDNRQQIKLVEEGHAVFEGHRLKAEDLSPVSLPITDAAVTEWLKPTVLIQSKHPKLVEKAKEIVGDETDALKASSLLCDWVSANMRTTFSARLSNSLEVLESLEGDCTEHSALFIGLARAAGLPAREVGGLIYVNSDPGFYYHQWAKVWIGEWVDVDPTFSQPLADATHIKLVEGDQLQMAKLIPVIGKLKVTVTEDEAAPADPAGSN